MQLAVSREVSRQLAVGEQQEADAFARAALRLGLIVTAPLVALGLVLVIPLRELLNVESTAAVALAMAGLVAAVALPISMGVLQGYQRFHAIAALYVLPFALRLALLALVISLGYGLGGAVFAAVAGGRRDCGCRALVVALAARTRCPHRTPQRSDPSCRTSGRFSSV